jgi:hypothetical protein
MEATDDEFDDNNNNNEENEDDGSPKLADCQTRMPFAIVTTRTKLGSIDKIVGEGDRKHDSVVLR